YFIPESLILLKLTGSTHLFVPNYLSFRQEKTGVFDEFRKFILKIFIKWTIFLKIVQKNYKKGM
ncbi:MAG: hypothetical protein ACYSU4_11520, partial [Planctomycetota bacterium]